MKCELCQRVVTQDEAQFADSIKPNTGMTLCPECAESSFSPESVGDEKAILEPSY